MATSTNRKKKNYIFAGVAGLAAGLYPMIFFYTNNFSLINSWKHFTFFLGLFLVVPTFGFITIQYLSRIAWVEQLKPKLFPFLNSVAFLCFIQICLYAKLQLWLTVGAVLVAGLIAFFLRKYFRKIIAIELLLALVGLFWLFPTIKNQWTYSNECVLHPARWICKY